MKERAGIQSVEVGFSLLHALSKVSGPLMLRDLAAAADMSPSLPNSGGITQVYTTPPQVGQKLRTASPPCQALATCWRGAPLKRTRSAGKPMKGMKPEPEALRQSAQ